MNTTATALPLLHEATTSDRFQTIATIAGGKAHRVSAETLLEDAQYERPTYPGSRYTRTEVMPAGETLYYYTACGTIRSAGHGLAYGNSYRPADEVTCTKCLKHG